jgi:hypothetical protein
LARQWVDRESVNLADLELDDRRSMREGTKSPAARKPRITCRCGDFGPRAPAVDRLRVEAPIGAYLEGRELSLFDQPINGGRMNPEIIRNLFQRHYVNHSPPPSIA